MQFKRPRFSRCIFCGRRETSEEHILPNWLRAIFPRSPADTYTFGEMPPQALGGVAPSVPVFSRPGRLGTLKVKCVCENHCNNGWMSRMEVQLKPTLSGLVFGRTRFLSERERLRLAAWAIKTVMVAEHYNPVPNMTPQSDRQYLMEFQRPPPGWFVWAGRQSTAKWAEGISHSAGMMGEYSVRSTTIGIGSLLFYVVGTTEGLLRLEVEPQRLVPIWPMQGRYKTWPGAASFDHAELIDALAVGILQTDFSDAS